jgi:L-cysteine/cystine lyase
MRAEEERGLREGRGSAAQFERILALREVVRAAVAELVDVTAERVALTASTTDGCNIVLAGLDLDEGDEIVTTTDEHFGLLGPLHVSEGDGRRRGAGCGAHRGRDHAAHAPARGLARPVDDGRAAARPRAALGDRDPSPRRRRAVRRRDPGATRTAVDFYTISGRSGSAGQRERARSSSRTRGAAVARPSYLSQRAHAPDGAFEPKEGAARFDPNLTPHPLTAGFRAAVDAVPPGGYERASALAERFRERLREAGQDVVVPRERATLVAWRAPVDESAAIVRRLADAGVIVRDLPGRGLVRASVGWWNDEDDLERLVAAL